MDKIFINTSRALYSLPRLVVAEHRASNYEEKGTKEGQEEVNGILTDEAELMDGLYNNTDPEDFEDDIVLEEKYPNAMFTDWQDDSIFHIGFSEVT